MSLWKGVHSDFSEIDTSGTDVSLSALASCDLADIIVEENALTNTDYINNNFEEEKEENDNNGKFCGFKHPLTTSGTSANNDGGEASPGNVRDENSGYSETSDRFKSGNVKDARERRYPCIVCKKKFAEKAKMKAHVKATHLRHVVLCNVCGKRMFQDKFAKHQQIFHSQSF